jgi:Cell division protein CrgA
VVLDDCRSSRRITVPVSKRRKKADYTPEQTMGERKVAKIGSPAWLAPLMVACFVVGLAYIVLFYLAGSTIPVMENLSALVNVGIGFGIILIGFFLSTRWR